MISSSTLALRLPSATPQTLRLILDVVDLSKQRQNLHWVGSPKDKSESTNGKVEVANLAAASGSSLAAANNELPDNHEVGNAGNGVPAPLLWSTLRAEGSKETGQDHDNISDNGNEDAATVHASQKGKIQEEKWGGQSPVDVTSPVDLAVDL